jgi:hypothetical protein
MKKSVGVLALLAVAALLLFTLIRSGEEGPGPVPAPARVNAKPPVVPARVTPAPAPAAAPVEPKAAPEPKRSGVRGRVLGGDGLPLDQAWVSAPGVPGVMTDAEGRFELFAPDGRALVEFAHRGHLPRVVPLEVPCEGIDVRLDRGLAVSGRVTFPDGSPAPGVDIHAEGTHYTGETDDTGRFSIAGLAPGQVVVHCAHTGPRRSVDAGASGVDFVLESHLLRFHPADTDGNPVAEAYLSYTGHDDENERMSGGGPVRGTISARTGILIKYSLTATGFDRKTGQISLEGPPSLHDVRVVMRRPGERGSISLTVADDRGRPLRKVYVTALDGAGEISGELYQKALDLDAGGRGVLEGLQPGTLRLEVGESGGAGGSGSFGLKTGKEVRIEPGKATPVEFLLPSGGRIRVTFRDAAGTVLAPAEVRLRDEKGNSTDTSFWGSDAPGRWSWPSDAVGPRVSRDPVPPGRYTVEVLKGSQTGGYEVAASAEVQVAPRETAEVEVRLAK